MSDFYEEGLKLYKEKKYEEAYKLFLLGAKEGDSRCIHAKGLCFWQGKGVKQNKTLGKKIVKENISRLEEDGLNNKPGANKLLHLAYSLVEFCVDNKKNFKTLQRIYDNKVELEEGFLISLAECYQNAKGVERNYVKANELYEECALKYNSAQAMYNLGLNYLSGFTNNNICKPEVLQGVEYLKQASALDYGYGIISLIKIYLGLNPFDIKEYITNYDLAKEYIERLIRLFPISGKIYLSLYYAIIHDFSNMEKVLEELDIGVKENVEQLWDRWSEITNGISYSSRNVIERVEKWKVACFEKLSKANLSNEKLLNTYMAYFYLNTYYDYTLKHGGKFFDKKEEHNIYENVKKYYLKGIENNEYLSFIDYGKLLLEGDHIEKDERKALELFKKSYTLEPDGDTANEIARIYEYGIGIKKNKRKAIEYYLKASKTDNGYAWALLNLIYYFSGSKNIQEKEKVKKLEKELFKRGIECDLASINSIQGLVNDSYSRSNYFQENKLFWMKEYFYKRRINNTKLHEIASLYIRGCGVKKDAKKALELYKRALTNGELYAAIDIGVIYFEGKEGIKKNIPLAIKYLEKGKKAFGYLGYANLQLYRIYADKDSKYFNIEKAINCLEKVPEDEEYSIGEAKYLLGYTYHSSGLIKRNLSKAIEYYKQACKNGYNCEYAIDLAKRELLSEKLFNEGKAKGLSNKEARLYARKEIEKNDTNNAFREFVVKNLINQAQTKQEKLQAIKQELQTDFGDVWEDLGKEAQKALITGIYIYSAMLEVGTEYYNDFDFAPVINQFSKAYEIQLKKYFYKGFLQYVKRKKISVYEFVNPNEVRQISIVETYYKNKKRTKVGYRYFDEQNENVNPFSLGSLKYIITFDPFSKNAYFNTEINKHVLSYVKELFKEDIFEFAHYDIDIKNYLLDLANDTKTIMDRRNPSAHGAFMSIDEAEVCANYLMKVKKVIYRFVSKIKEEYREGN